MTTATDLKAQYIAALKAQVAADPAVGPLIAQRAAIAAQIAPLAAQIKPLQVQIASLNAQINKTAPVETRSAMRMLQMLGSA